MDAVLPVCVWHRGMRWKALIEGEIRDDNPDVFWFRVIYQGAAEATEMAMSCAGFYVQRKTTPDQIPDLLEMARTSDWESLPLCIYAGDLLCARYCQQEAAQPMPAAAHCAQQEAPLLSGSALSARPVPPPPPLLSPSLQQQQQQQQEQQGQQHEVEQQPVQQLMQPAQSSQQEAEASDYATAATAASGRTGQTAGTKRKKHEDDVFSKEVRI